MAIEWLEAVAASVILIWAVMTLNDMRDRGRTVYSLAVIAAGIWAGTYLMTWLVDLSHPHPNPEILLMALIVILAHQSHRPHPGG